MSFHALEDADGRPIFVNTDQVEMIWEALPPVPQESPFAAYAGSFRWVGGEPESPNAPDLTPPPDAPAEQDAPPEATEGGPPDQVDAADLQQEPDPGDEAEPEPTPEPTVSTHLRFHSGEVLRLPQPLATVRQRLGL